MLNFKASRLTLFSLFLIVPGVFILCWWAWQGLEVNRQAENRRIHHFEELASYQVVNNLGLELFHLSFTFSVGIRESQPVETILETYQKQARFPALLQDVYQVKRLAENTLQWSRWSSGAWVVQAPPSWAPPASAVFDEPSEPSVSLESPTMTMLMSGRGEKALLVRYSVKEVIDTIVPALVKKAFGESGMGQDYAVTVFRQERGTGVLDPPADMIVPLVPQVRFSDWLFSYLDRTGTPLPDPLVARYMQSLAHRPTLQARWALAVSLKPSGLAAFDRDLVVRNLAGAGLLFLVVGGGLGLFFFSIRGLLQAAARERAFTTLVSHELKTPLAAIRSLSENLALGLVADVPRAKTYGTELLAQTSRLGEMVGNVLLLARLKGTGTKLVRETFDAGDLVAEAAALAQLPSSRDPGPWLALGNRAAVGAALDNLVTNALRYGFHEGQAPTVRLSLLRDVRWGAAWVGIAVTDHGPGLSVDDRKQIFQPYRRGRAAQSRQTPGGGIGLSLVKATMTHLRGRVQVRSVPGGGLTVVLWLREGSLS